MQPDEKIVPNTATSASFLLLISVFSGKWALFMLICCYYLSRISNLSMLFIYFNQIKQGQVKLNIMGFYQLNISFYFLFF